MYFVDSAPQSTLLVLEGVKMGASVLLNGMPLGNATDQFVRYTFTLRVAKGALERQIASLRAQLEVFQCFAAASLGVAL